MSQYPIYRKHNVEAFYCKVLNDTQMVSISLDNKIFDAAIGIVNMKEQDFDPFDDEKTIPITRDEFEKAYNKALWKFNKTNTVL